MSDPPAGDFHTEDSGVSLVPALTARDFGFALGNYVCECHRCAKQFMGDKRAITCGDCAEALVAAAVAPAVEPEIERSLVPARLRPLPISRAMAHAGARVLRTFTGDEFNLSIKVFAAMDRVRREEAG